jgi:hypothetical protein
VSSGLADNQVTIWWITLALGVVVLLVVILLLLLLSGIVRDVGGNVGQVLVIAGAVAENTAAAGALAQTAELSGTLHEEVGRHARLLSSAAGAR